MFTSDNVRKYGNGLTLKRFINAFVYSGKTTCVLEQAKRCIEKGEKVAVVTNHTWIMKNEYPKQLTFIHMDKLLKELNRYPLEGNEWTEKEPAFVPKKYIKLFEGYDRVFVEPACYEVIIETLIDILKQQTRALNKVKELWKEC